MKKNTTTKATETKSTKSSVKVKDGSEVSLTGEVYIVTDRRDFYRFAVRCANSKNEVRSVWGSEKVKTYKDCQTKPYGIGKGTVIGTFSGIEGIFSYTIQLPGFPETVEVASNQVFPATDKGKEVASYWARSFCAEQLAEDAKREEKREEREARKAEKEREETRKAKTKGKKGTSPKAETETPKKGVKKVTNKEPEKVPAKRRRAA